MLRVCLLPPELGAPASLPACRDVGAETRRQGCRRSQCGDVFMAPMHARRRNETSHEPCPLTPSLSPDGGEGVRRTGEGDARRFMGPVRGQHTVETLHEPEDACLDSEGFRFSKFKVPIHAQKRKVAFHEPELGAPASCRRVAMWVRKLAGKDAGAPSMVTCSWFQCMRDSEIVETLHEPDRGCVRSTSRSAPERTNPLRLGLRPQPRSGPSPVHGPNACEEANGGFP